jgi:diadenylate cyclase
LKTEGRHREERTRAPSGVHRRPRDQDPRRDPKLLSAISRVAPGTELRQGIDDIIRSRSGALIVIGEPSEFEFMVSGGMRLDLDFSPQLLYELAKMDGAIILDPELKKLAYANVQLMPDPAIPSAETGTRHRTAERVAKQTGALVISISQQRETVTLFMEYRRYQLDTIADVLAKTNQAVATVETYRQRLEQVLTRLTALEFQNAVMLDDVLIVLQRMELTTRMAAEVEREYVELGSEGRLIRIRLEELMADVPREKNAIIFDYHSGNGEGVVEQTLERLGELSYQQLLESEELAEALGYRRNVNPLDYAVTPRGLRVLAQIPRLPEGVARRVVARLESLETILRASGRELEAVEGVGQARAREIREGLRRLQEHNLVDRYLQL